MTHSAGLPVDRRGVRRWWIVLAVLIVVPCVLPLPRMPQASIDGDWIAAMEWAAHHDLTFGRDVVFTMGPLATLATGLYAPDTFGWVLLAAAIVTMIWMAPLALAPRPYPLMLFVAAIPAAATGFDARFVAALLSASLLTIVRPGWWSLAPPVVWGVLSLSKLSMALVALPLMLFLDACALVSRSGRPFHAAAFLCAFLATLTLAGTPPALWATALSNDGAVIAGYSGAMPFAVRPGDMLALVAGLALLVALMTFAGGLIWERRGASRRGRIEAVAMLLAIAWCLWMAFKMGYVRADEHMVVTWAVVAMAVPAIVGICELRDRLETRQRIAALLLLAAAQGGMIDLAVKTIGRPEPGRDPPGTLADLTRDMAMRPGVALSWLSPAAWRAATARRAAAEARIARRFPFPAGTRADAIPSAIGPVIHSNLVYAPRPVPQSYTAYTPWLQDLDARHFASAAAPDILFLDVLSEIDERLPTLATGPSLPLIAARYDPVGTDALGAVLRRRARPLPLRSTATPAIAAPFGRWVGVPRAPRGGFVTAEVRTAPGLLARATGLLAREPVIFVELRGADGAAMRYRFVPGMAERGVVISPMVRDPTAKRVIADRGIGMVRPGSRPRATVEIVAMRFVGDGLAPLAFHPPRLRFRLVAMGAQ